jgi:hypothetical protein
MKMMELEEGMNVISPSRFGKMHIWVRDGNVYSITIFNSSISKRKTHVQQYNGKKLHHVDLGIKADGLE